MASVYFFSFCAEIIMAQQPMPGGPGVGDESLLLCRVFVPHLNLKKTIRIDPVLFFSSSSFFLTAANLDTQTRTKKNDAVWELKLKFIEKMSLEVDKEEDPYNFGIYLPKAGVYLDEQRLVSSYYFSDNVRSHKATVHWNPYLFVRSTLSLSGKRASKSCRKSKCKR